MRRIGLLGGMSWESSVEYERIINRAVRRRRGGVHSADLLVRSFDFGDIERLQRAGEWEKAGQLLQRAAMDLASIGAEVLGLCTNTMHKVAGPIESIPGTRFVHIADATADAAQAAGATTVGLLGTRFTMEEPFLRDRLRTRGLDVVVPDDSDRETVHQVIYTELVQGIIDERSRDAYRAVMDRLLAAGADAIVAGCTEIELLVGPQDVEAPFLPSTRLHAEAIAAAALDTALD